MQVPPQESAATRLAQTGLGYRKSLGASKVLSSTATRGGILALIENWLGASRPISVRVRLRTRLSELAHCHQSCTKLAHSAFERSVCSHPISEGIPRLQTPRSLC